MQAERIQALVLEAHHWQPEDLSPEELKTLAAWLEVSRQQFPQRWRAVQEVSAHLYPGQRGSVQTYLRRGNVCTIARAAGLGQLDPLTAEAEILTFYNRLVYSWRRWQRHNAPPPIEQLSLF